jgi:iron complex outermembrane receptor protein
MYKFLFTTIGILLTMVLPAQENPVLTGYVFDLESGLPIENVDVQVLGKKLGTTTDQKGFFECNSISMGSVTMVFKHIAYFSKEEKIKLNSSEKKEIKVFLSPNYTELTEVVVEAENRRTAIISRMPFIQTRVFGQQIEENAVRDIGELLRGSNNISGIRKGGGAIDPVVRGFKFSQLNVQIDDGLKIEGGCPNRMDPATAQIDPSEVKEIEVLKGPYAFRYGTSFGGVVNIKTMDIPENDKSKLRIKALKGFESNWNGNKGLLNINGGNRKVFFNISGSQKKYGNYKDGNGEEVKSYFTKQNFGGYFGFRPAKNQSIVLSYKNSTGENTRFPALPMDERLEEVNLASLDYTAREIGGFFRSVSVKLYNSDVNHQMDNKYRAVSDTVVAVSDIHAINRGFRSEGLFLLKSAKFHFGIDFENILKDGERVKTMIKQYTLPVKTEKLWNKGQIWNLGFFLTYGQKLNNFDLSASARFDRNHANSDKISISQPNIGEIYSYGTDSIQTDFNNFSFSFGATYHFNKSFSTSLSVGRGIRSPDMTERFIILLPIGYDNFDYLGNPQLKPEANNQVDLTLKYVDGKKGAFQFNVFYSLVNDFIIGKRLPPAEQRPLSKGVIGVKQFVNGGNARFSGFELGWFSPEKYKPGVQVLASYTYATIDEVKGHVVETGFPIRDETILNDALTEIPPFESTLTVFYPFLNGKLKPEVSVRMVAAQNHVSDAFYEKTTPGFVIADFLIRYNFNKNFTVSGGVDNIFNKAYYEHLNRNIIGSSKNLYEPGRVFYVNLIFNIGN